MMKPKHKKLLSIIIIFSMLFALCLPHDVKPIYAKYTYDYFTFENVYFIITGDPDGASINPITPTLRVSTLYSTDTIKYPNVAELKTLTKDTYFNGASFTGEIALANNNSVPSDTKKIIIPSNYYTIPENFLTGNTSIEEIVINSTNDIVLEKNCFSNMTALKKVTISANSVTLNGSVFFGCNNLETISITGKTTIANSQNFNNCSKLNTLNFNSDVNFISSSDFNSTSFSSCPNGATINFNGAVTNKASVFSYCKNITNINFNGYGNKLSNKFIFYSTVTNLNIENQTTLETNFLYDDKKHPITNLSFNATTIINDKAFYEGTIKNMYFNIDNRNNSKAISYVNSTDRLGYNTKVENIYFNYKDFHQIPDKVMELNNFPLGDTDTSSLNCDAIYFLNPNFKYIGGSDYDRCDGGTTDVYGYGGAVAYDTNGNIISSYEMYQSWIENKHCTFHNYVSNADTLNYSLKNNVVYLPANSNTIAYDFSSTNNITAYATYIDNTTPYDEINNQLKSSSEFPLTMATGETSSNFNYRILQKNNSVAGTNKDYYVYKYGNDYYTVCTNTVLNLTEGEHNFLIEAGGVKHPFKITVKKNVIEKITDVQPKSGSTLNLNYGETLEKDMLTVRAQYTNGENVILTNDQYDIENPLITAENLTITVSAKSDGTKKASNTIQVNGYPDEAKTFEVVCNKTEMPSGSTLTLADVQLKNVSYVNPSKPTDATIESGFKFIVDGKEVSEVPIKLGINTISVSYKNYIVNNAIIIQGIENKISKVEAEYIGTGVYENCQVPTNAAVLAVYVYKNGSNTRELVTDYSKVTLENYKIIANQNNMITVYYDGIKAENPIVVPGLKDNVNTLDTVTYNGPCTIGTQLNQKDFYIEITLSSGTVLNSNSTPELLNALTFSEEKLNGETNQIKVTYDGKLEKTITINCNSVANTNAPTATLSPSPTTSSGPAITPTAGAIITTGPAVTQTPIVSSAPVPTVTPTPTIKATTKPTITPTIKPTITPTAEPTAEPTSTPTTTKPTVKKGKTYLVKNVRYKVRSFNKKRGTVAIVGYKKSAKSISVKSTVKIKGYTFTVVSIQSNAFKNCTALKGTIRIPSTITTVGNSAFYGCKNITCVVIGKKVKSIGSNCFYKCSKLKQVDLRSAKKLTKVGKAAFKKNASSRVFKIAKGTTSRFSKLLKGKY